MTNAPTPKFAVAKLSAALATLVEPFGWTISDPILRAWTDRQRTAVELWLKAHGETANYVAPRNWLQAVDIPIQRRRAFKNEYDAKALAAVILQTRADFTAIATTPETSIEILKSREFEMTQGIGTIFGTVYFEGETLSLWFGRKYNQLPALARESTAAALRKLFEIVDNSERNGKA